jgi:outer membrane protein
MRRLILAFACLLLGNGILQAQQPTVLSLDQAIQYAFQNNPTLERSQISIADADQQIVERRAIGVPQLSAAVNYQYFIDIPTQILPDFISPAVYGVLFQEGVLPPRQLETDESGVPAQFGTKHNLTAGLNLDAMIFDGSFFVGLQAARAYRGLVQSQYTSDQYTIKSQVIETYLPVLLIDMNLQTLENNLNNLETLLAETRALYEEGFVELLDVDRLALSVDNLQVEYNKLERQKSQALNGLKMILGFPMDEDLEVTGTIEELLYTGDAVELTGAINPTVRPDYQAAQRGETLNELNVRLNKSLYLPSLYAFGSYQQSLFANELSEGEWFPTTVVGLNLRVPIFDGLNKKAKVQRAQLGLENTQSQLRELERFINMEVTNARLAYNNAQQTLDDRQQNLDLANRIYNTTLIKYKEGVGSSLEINQAEQSLFLSQQNYNLALYDLLVAKMALKRAMGQL